MARRSANVLSLLVGSAVAVASLLVLGRSAPAMAAISVAGAQKGVAEFILSTTALIFNAALSLLPGVMVAFTGYTVYARRESMTRKKWAVLGVGIFMSLILWSVHFKFNEKASEMAPPSNVRGEAMVGSVRSGELKATTDGRIVSLPDPSKPEGSPVMEGWQQALALAMTDAIKTGKEQVVLVFSTQGCPWCDRQKPVLARAMVQRAQALAGAGAAVPAAAFVGGGAAGGLMNAPLRVFVLDAGEFPYLAQQFGIEAFPTSMFFGVPGATPLLARGYLDDEKIQEVLQAAATARPEERGAGGERQAPKKKRGLFR
mmetsp:Transcript_85089/g.216742  ORF Transcript_85089/g.216742 Transcript_85089/m.216742 type:complete len:315 (-) Transcript_85089:76-1020(-)